jgi:hypothetical protein
MHTLVAGLVLVLATYATVTGLIATSVGWWWALGYVVVLPFAASLDFWWSDRWRFARQRVRAFLAQRKNPSRALDLIEERDRLRDTARRLSVLLP